jgi:hypothetical protein
MKAHFKDNILTVTNHKGQALQYIKDGDKWRNAPTQKMVTYEEHLMLNRILDMARDARREGRVIKL